MRQNTSGKCNILYFFMTNHSFLTKATLVCTMPHPGEAHRLSWVEEAKLPLRD